MKKIFRFCLFAGLVMIAPACEKGLSPEEEEAFEKADSFWSVVGQLVSSDDYTEDYQDKTFEPMYGMPEGENSLTRIVNTNDLKTAAQRFSQLVNANIDETTETYTFEDPNVGTLTYTKIDDGAKWATVDVDIRQIPHLEQIVYQIPGAGENASFGGRAYYRFGDIVKKTNEDGDTEYWICVRPAFGPEGKEDSEWVCVNTLPDRNMLHQTKSKKDYYIPRGIGTSAACMQNFAEMLYAIFNPQEWEKNCLNYHQDGESWGYKGMPIFSDFKVANIQYHNQYFWRNVQKGWAVTPELEKAFNADFDSIRKSVDSGVSLLYYGYYWKSASSWMVTLYEAEYTNGKADAEQNFHKEDFSTPRKSVKNINLDCRLMGADLSDYDEFFEDGKLRWHIRYSTGEKLSNTGRFHVREAIPGVTEVYRYYTVYPVSSLEDEPEITLE